MNLALNGLTFFKMIIFRLKENKMIINGILPTVRRFCSTYISYS